MPEPLSLLMTTDAIGGVWSHALDLCRGLSKRGARITLVVLGPPPLAAEEAVARAIPGLELHHVDGALEWMTEPWSDVKRSGSRLLALSARTEPDVVHLNGYCHAALSFGAPTLVAGHSCVLSWWRAVEQRPVPSGLERYRAEVRAGLRAADLVVAPTRHMLSSLQRHYGPLESCRVIANGTEPSSAPPLPKAPLALCAGRLWDRAKNLELLSRAARDLPWPVFVAGEGGAGACDGLQHLGRLTRLELAHWQQRASIYVAPCRYEPFGLAILEAALAGAALVLGDIPSLREVWGTAASYVHPDDETSLRRELLRLMHDGAARHALARRARRRAERFSLQAMIDAYWHSYRELRRAGGTGRLASFALAGALEQGS